MPGARLLLELLLAWLASALLGRYLTGGVPLLDPFLLLTVYYGIHSRPPTGTVVGALAGLLQDALTGNLLCMNAFSKTLVGWVCHALGGRLLVTRTLPQVMILLSCTALDQIVRGALGYLLRGSFPMLPPGAFVLLLLSNTIVGTLLLRLADSRRRAALASSY